MSNRNEKIVHYANGLSSKSVDLLVMPEQTAEYAQALITSYQHMIKLAHQVASVDHQRVTVFNFPRGGTIGASETVKLLGNRSDLRTVDKQTQKLVRSIAEKNQYKIQPQSFIESNVFSATSRVMFAPESFVNQGTTIAASAAQTAHAAAISRDFLPKHLIVMSPTVRDEGVKTLERVNEELRTMGWAGISIITYEVLTLDDNQIPEHGDVNQAVVDQGWITLSKSHRDFQ